MYSASRYIGSPEQMRGDRVLTVKTDVYSLGVVLYELLAGQSPYGDNRFLETLPFEKLRERVLENRIEAPSKVCDHSRRKQIERDLDAVTLKALELEPENRYASVEELSRDVQNYLDNIPVTAKSHGPIYRLRKLVRRNRVAISATTAVLLSLAIGTTVSISQWNRAERHFLRTWHALQEFSTSVLQSEHDFRDEPWSQQLRARLLETARVHLEAFLADRDHDRWLQAEVAKAHFNLGLVYEQTSRREEAIGAYRSALRIQERLASENPSDWELRSDAAETLNNLGHSLVDQDDKVEERLACYRRALRYQEQIASEHSDSPRVYFDVVETLHSVGALCWEAEKLDEGVASLGEAIRILRWYIGQTSETRHDDLLGRIYTLRSSVPMPVNEAHRDGSGTYLSYRIRQRAGLSLFSELEPRLCVPAKYLL